jgi:hypothetical protein
MAEYREEIANKAIISAVKSICEIYAYESALGSDFKVDASYVSTDLKILQRIDNLCD